MASIAKAPFVSIIISTRNRPHLFQIALRSVLSQSFAEKEVIAVIDGSTDENLAQYRNLKTQYPNVMFRELEHRPNGHGQSFTMNYGVVTASGEYVCFLDDDDYWIDDQYLANLFDNITACRTPVDVHYSNQKAVFADGVAQQENVWIQDLIPKLDPKNVNHGDSYLVDAQFLLSSSGFAHLNCTVLKRKFFLALGGMDESIRYENDRDVYIRSVDAASVILFSTRFMSLHNIPDISQKNNMSTVSTAIDKKLFQLRVYDKGIAQSKKAIVMRFCCTAKGYELKHTARILASYGAHRSAAYYAKEALFVGFNLRWLAYTFWLMGQAAFRTSKNFIESHG